MSNKQSVTRNKIMITTAGLLTVTTLGITGVLFGSFNTPEKTSLAAPYQNASESQFAANSQSSISTNLPTSLQKSRPQSVIPDENDRINIKFKSLATDDQKKKIIDESGSVSGHIKNEKLKLPNESVIKVKNPRQKDALLESLRKNPNVEYAEVDSKQNVELTTNDPLVQWHQNNIATATAWNTSTGSNVLVAVCDSGVQSNHPDLQANLRADLGYNIYTSSNLGWDLLEHPHGTMVSGTLAATANNAQGGRGVAFNAQIMPLKVTYDSTGSTYLSYLSSCIKYAADNGAKVINVSFTGANSYTIDNAAQYASALGSTVVFAAGNSGTSLNYVNFKSVIAVSATDENNKKSTFSDYGPYVDVSAPGSNISTTSWNGGYAKVNGTSFAAPIVAANIALALSVKPTLTPAQVLTLVTTSTDDLGTKGYDTQFGHGKINAAKIVTNASAL